MDGDCGGWREKCRSPSQCWESDEQPLGEGGPRFSLKEVWAAPCLSVERRPPRFSQSLTFVFGPSSPPTFPPLTPPLAFRAQALPSPVLPARASLTRCDSSRAALIVLHPLVVFCEHTSITQGSHLRQGVPNFPSIPLGHLLHCCSSYTVVRVLLVVVRALFWVIMLAVDVVSAVGGEQDPKKTFPPFRFNCPTCMVIFYPNWTSFWTEKLRVVIGSLQRDYGVCRRSRRYRKSG